MTTKEKIIEAVSALPSDTTYREAIERLYVLYNIEKGIQDVNEGLVYSQEEAKRRMAHWLQ